MLIDKMIFTLISINHFTKTTQATFVFTNICPKSGAHQAFLDKNLIQEIYPIRESIFAFQKVLMLIGLTPSNIDYTCSRK